jgi:hypothetical protein
VRKSFAYRVYGLQLQADRSLSGVLRTEASGKPDLDVDFTGGLPEDVRARTSEWRPVLRTGTDEHEAVLEAVLEGTGQSYVRLRYAIDHGTADFIVDRNGSRIWAAWPASVIFDDVSALLLGPVLGRTLRLRGIPCLHGSAVVMAERALALVGSKAAGKSTTAAGLAVRGHAVLADDLTALSVERDAYLVHPGYLRLRLWKPAIDAFYGSRDALPRVQSNRNKRYLDLTTTDDRSKWRFQDRPSPLGAVYVLAERRATNDAPSVLPVSPAQALLVLTAHSYAHETLDREARAREFAFLAQLVRHVPVRRVERPDDMNAVPQLCSAIEKDFEQLARKPRRR